MFFQLLFRFFLSLSVNSKIGLPLARWPVFHRHGRYFTDNLAEAGKKPVFKK